MVLQSAIRICTTPFYTFVKEENQQLSFFFSPKMQPHKIHNNRKKLQKLVFVKTVSTLSFIDIIIIIIIVINKQGYCSGLFSPLKCIF